MIFYLILLYVIPLVICILGFTFGQDGSETRGELVVAILSTIVPFINMVVAWAWISTYTVAAEWWDKPLRSKKK
jgi:hypothetical protein